MSKTRPAGSADAALGAPRLNADWSFTAIISLTPAEGQRMETAPQPDL